MDTNDITRRQALCRVGVLLGAAVTAPTVAGVLSGCRRQTGADWSPSLLSEAQNEVVSQMAQIIIPATDTPGADAAHVNRFIDAMVGESYLEKDRKRFMDGLEEVRARCKERYGAPFPELGDEKQRAVVAELDDAAFGPDASEDREEPTFYRTFKELVVIGYYTSEVGATQELKTNIVPGYYDGDVPYSEIGRAWSGAGT
ncbi:MAG: gluconate 2-dehydrogenase subunit 3 family protein [Salinibacter sp.]